MFKSRNEPRQGKAWCVVGVPLQTTILRSRLSDFRASVVQDLEELQKKAADSDVDALYQLGVRYQKGDGVRQDVPRAIQLFEQAAQAGHGIGMNALGTRSVWATR